MTFPNPVTLVEQIVPPPYGYYKLRLPDENFQDGIIGPIRRMLAEPPRQRLTQETTFGAFLGDPTGTFLLAMETIARGDLPQIVFQHITVEVRVTVEDDLIVARYNDGIPKVERGSLDKHHQMWGILSEVNDDRVGVVETMGEQIIPSATLVVPDPLNLSVCPGYYQNSFVVCPVRLSGQTGLIYTTMQKCQYERERTNSVWVSLWQPFWLAIHRQVESGQLPLFVPQEIEGFPE